MGLQIQGTARQFSEAETVVPRPGAAPGGRQGSRPGNEDSPVLTAAVELTAVAGS